MSSYFTAYYKFVDVSQILISEILTPSTIPPRRSQMVSAGRIARALWWRSQMLCPAIIIIIMAIYAHMAMVSPHRHDQSIVKLANLSVFP
jgi:hypothetical protein